MRVCHQRWDTSLIQQPLSASRWSSSSAGLTMRFLAPVAFWQAKSCELWNVPLGNLFYFYSSVSLWRLRRDGPRLFRRPSRTCRSLWGRICVACCVCFIWVECSRKAFSTDPFFWESSCCAGFIDYPSWVSFFFFLCLSWTVIVSYLSHSSGPFVSRSLCFASGGFLFLILLHLAADCVFADLVHICTVVLYLPKSAADVDLISPNALGLLIELRRLSSQKAQSVAGRCPTSWFTCDLRFMDWRIFTDWPTLFSPENRLRKLFLKICHRHLFCLQPLVILNHLNACWRKFLKPYYPGVPGWIVQFILCSKKLSEDLTFGGGLQPLAGNSTMRKLSFESLCYCKWLNGQWSGYILITKTKKVKFTSRSRVELALCIRQHLKHRHSLSQVLQWGVWKIRRIDVSQLVLS